METIKIIEASPLLTMWSNDAPDLYKIEAMMLHIDWELGNIRKWKAERGLEGKRILRPMDDPGGDGPPDYAAMTEDEKIAALFVHIEAMLDRIEAFKKATTR